MRLMLSWNKLNILLLVFVFISLYKLLKSSKAAFTAVLFALLFSYMSIIWFNAPVIDTTKPSVYSDGCHVSSNRPKVPCIFGNRSSKLNIALVGDSHAAQYFNTLREIAVTQGYSMASWTKSSCPLLESVTVLPDSKLRSCFEWQRNVLEEIKLRDPTLIIIGNLTNDLEYAKENAGTSANFLNRFKSLLSELEINKSKILVIEDNPKPEFDVVKCGRVESLFISIHRCDFPAKLSILTKLQRNYLISENIAFIRSVSVLCESTCIAYRNRHNLYRDDSHLSILGADTLKNSLKDKIITLLSQDK